MANMGITIPYAWPLVMIVIILANYTVAVAEYSDVVHRRIMRTTPGGPNPLHNRGSPPPLGREIR